MYNLKRALRDDVEKNYVELMKNEEKDIDKGSKVHSTCQFPFLDHCECEKLVFVREARKLEFSSDVNLMNEICVICRENFTTESRVVVLRCGHDYHEKCFRDWVVDKDISPCPLCQKQVLVKTFVRWKVK